ncbi:MAG: metallophosphoesterase family protein [Bacillota bacterium]
MKIAVISDIHGNIWALREVLKDIRKRDIEQIINLGDSLYGPLDPMGTAEILIKENIISISGNQDRSIVEARYMSHINYTMEYTLNEINEDVIKWLSSLEKNTVLEDQSYLCHGKPDADDEYLVEETEQSGVTVKLSDKLMKELECIEQKLIFCGHSHLPRSVLLPNGKVIVNPGSVGLQAYNEEKPFYYEINNGSPHARYSIVEMNENGLNIENIALEYDWNTAAECASKNKRYDWGKWLSTGIC